MIFNHRKYNFFHGEPFEPLHRRIIHFFSTGLGDMRQVLGDNHPQGCLHKSQVIENRRT